MKSLTPNLDKILLLHEAAEELARRDLESVKKEEMRRHEDGNTSSDVGNSDEAGASSEDDAGDVDYAPNEDRAGVEDISVDEAESSEEEVGLPTDDRFCMAVPVCVEKCKDHRKIIAHIFGRNKNCTRGLPESAWVFWCRKHYQRGEYRAKVNGIFHNTQLRLVREQLTKFERAHVVKDWTIALRKAQRDAITAENKRVVAGIAVGRSRCWERFLLPHTGSNKSFAEVRAVLDVIETEFRTTAFRHRDKMAKDFPGVELLPNLRAKHPTASKQKSIVPTIPHKRKAKVEEDEDEDVRVHTASLRSRRRRLVRGCRPRLSVIEPTSKEAIGDKTTDTTFAGSKTADSETNGAKDAGASQHQSDFTPINA